MHAITPQFSAGPLQVLPIEESITIVPTSNGSHLDERLHGNCLLKE